MNLAFKKVLFLLLCLCSFSSYAQIGARISLFNPTADLGPTFKKAIAYDVYYVAGRYDQRFRFKAGVSYTQPKPRLDSFPVAIYQGGNDEAFFPGKISYSEFELIYGYFNIDVKMLQLHKFYWYGGLSLAIGMGHSVYHRVYETLLDEHSDIQDAIAGFIFRSSIEYSLNDHLGLYIEGSKSSFTNNTWSTGYGHYNFGIGFNYQIKASEE
jgi:hypothetical protein